MFSSRPPRTALFLKRSAWSRLGLSIVQSSAKRLRTPPELSLPTEMPPWPSFIWQRRMTMFSEGTFRRRPSALRPDLTAMQSSCVKGAVFDENVFAGLGVAAVVVRAVALYAHAADGAVGAEHSVELPHRRVDDADAFDEHVRTAVGLDELRAEVVAFAKNALADRRAALGQLFERLARLQLVGCALLPAVALLTLPRPPVFVVAVAIERACAGDGDILLLKGIDERRVVHQFHTFPAREDEREIFRRVLDELDGRAFRNV